MSDDRRRPGGGSDSPEVSDLIGAELAIAVVIWLAVALICFFFVGAVAGIVAVFIGTLVAGIVLVWGRSGGPRSPTDQAAGFGSAGCGDGSAIVTM